MRAGEDARRIERLAAKLSDAQKLNAAVGRGFERTLRRHFRELDKRPNRRGWRKSHFWEKIAADTVFAGADDNRAVVSIGSDSGPKFAAKVFGARIRPKGGKKFLAIPAIEARYGVSPVEPRQERTPIPPDAPRRVARRHTRGRHNAGSLLARAQGRHPARPRRAAEERNRTGGREKGNFKIPTKMKNEELRTKNWGLRRRLKPDALTGAACRFMLGHKVIGAACECIGGNAAQFFVLSSSFFVNH